MQRRLGSYEVLDVVGRGGAGVVLRGRAPDGSVVAIKLLRDGRPAEAFDRERRLHEVLGETEGFVPLLESGADGSSRFLVMPFLAGGTLRGRLGAPLSIEEALRIATDLARAMALAHARGIVHRDLKPENVLFREPGGRALIADLGLAKHFRDDAPGASQSVALSVTGEFKGTAGYAAAEQMRDARAATPCSDVFALGALLYECLAGRPAFASDTFHGLIALVDSGRFAPLRSLRPEVPAWLAAVAERALARDPAARFEDAGALARALEGPVASRSRAPLLLAVGAALAVALGVAAATLGRSSPPVAPPPAAPAPAPPPPGAPFAPGWYLALGDAERPRRPLPPGVRFGDAPGEYVNERDGSVLVFVPEGSFMKGLGFDAAPEKTFVPAGFLGKYEVTVRQFAAFVAATGHRTGPERSGSGYVYRDAADELEQWVPMEGASWRNPEGPPARADDGEPVVQVTHDDACAYVAWAGLALPSEALWQKAATWDPATGATALFPWGEGPECAPGAPALANVMDLAFCRVHRPDEAKPDSYDDGFARRARPGSLPRDRSPVGVFDLSGNVGEWCEGVVDSAASPGVEMRPVRGASWTSPPHWAVPARPLHFPRNASSNAVGVRVSLRAGR